MDYARAGERRERLPGVYPNVFLCKKGAEREAVCDSLRCI